uniref:Uncharacterized protein n=1 Tax=Pseudictyota dubia TaxID=2749911 RepID=A0A7R9W4H8_9STRA
MFVSRSDVLLSALESARTDAPFNSGGSGAEWRTASALSWDRRERQVVRNAANCSRSFAWSSEWMYFCPFRLVESRLAHAGSSRLSWRSWIRYCTYGQLWRAPTKRF